MLNRCIVTNLILVLTLIPHITAQQDRKTTVRRGMWSTATVSLFNTVGGLDSNPGRKASFKSPDGKKEIVVNGENVSIRINGKSFRTNFGSKTNAELGWSPDSLRFFLTWTDGGLVGTWQVQVYEVNESGFSEIKGITSESERDFALLIHRLPIPAWVDKGKKPFWNGSEYCKYNNVVGSQWTAGSRELLLSVLVPNSSGCRFMAEFNVYRVAVPSGEILQRYTAEKARLKFNPANLPVIN